MSQIPPYADPTTEFPKRRPTSVTVIAIIGIVLGAFYTLCAPLGLLPFFVDFGQPNPLIDAMKAEQALLTYNILSTLVTWLLGIVLLVSSILALMVRPAGRLGMMAYAVGGLLLLLVGTVLNLMWLGPKMAEIQRQAGLPATPAAMTIATYAVGIVLGMVFPVAILLVMTRPHVQAAFAVGSEYPPAEPPYPPQDRLPM